MGLFDFLKRKANIHISTNQTGPVAPKLSSIEKERILVQRVTTEDMLQFSMIPYQLNCPIYKFTRDGGHPFAYMNLNEANQVMAKEELARISQYIVQAHEYIPLLTDDIYIKVKEVVFSEYSPYHGYTRLLCTPSTITGKTAKYPLCLSFATRLDASAYTAHGELYYGKDGSVLKANVYVWKRPSSNNAVGWFFYFKTIGRTFVLYQVKSTVKPGEDGLPGTVYQFSK